jgi:hypothetical protein
MKVHYKKNYSGYSGKDEEAVYYYHPKLKVSLMRAYVVPNNARNTDRHKLIMANLKLLQPSQGYKQNFSDYLLAYNQHPDYRHKPLLSWNNIYLKMMFAMQKTLPEQVDLKTITRHQIIAQSLPCRTLKSSIEAGLLPPMSGWEYWDKEI